MNIKLNMFALLVALTFAMPVNAETVDEQVRNQGRAALEALSTEIKQSLSAPSRVNPATVYPVNEAIRIQGQQAVRGIEIALRLSRYRYHGNAVATTD